MLQYQPVAVMRFAGFLRAIAARTSHPDVYDTGIDELSLDDEVGDVDSIEVSLPQVVVKHMSADVFLGEMQGCFPMSESIERIILASLTFNARFADCDMSLLLRAVQMCSARRHPRQRY